MRKTVFIMVDKSREGEYIGEEHNTPNGYKYVERWFYTLRPRYFVSTDTLVFFGEYLMALSKNTGSHILGIFVSLTFLKIYKL
jgi:hypothetical protein